VRGVARKHRWALHEYKTRNNKDRRIEERGRSEEMRCLQLFSSLDSSWKSKYSIPHTSNELAETPDQIGKVSSENTSKNKSAPINAFVEGWDIGDKINEIIGKSDEVRVEEKIKYLKSCNALFHGIQWR